MFSCEDHPQFTTHLTHLRGDPFVPVLLSVASLFSHTLFRKYILPSVTQSVNGQIVLQGASLWCQVKQAVILKDNM
jgi:hypothetical protein